jgi:hypothetical protein
MNKAVSAIIRLADNVLDCGDRETVQYRLTSVYTLDDVNESRTGFKHLIDPSNCVEHIRTLALTLSR